MANSEDTYEMFAKVCLGPQLRVKQYFYIIYFNAFQCISVSIVNLNHFIMIMTAYNLIHFRLNKLPHTIYWKSPISILSMSGYELQIFLEKNG